MRKSAKAGRVVIRLRPRDIIYLPSNGNDGSAGPKNGEPQEYKPALEIIIFPGHSTAEDQPVSRWLKFGDMALARAREEQCRIKQKNKPHVERYRRITRKDKAA